MPYIAIKAYKKDEKIKQEVVEEINRIFLEKWGCPQSAITVSIEEYSPEDWESKVRRGDIEAAMSSVMILEGEKKYK